MQSARPPPWPNNAAARAARRVKLRRPPRRIVSRRAEELDAQVARVCDYEQ